MPTWGSLGEPKGEYISPSFNVNNSLDNYMADIKRTVINAHNQKLDIYFRVSYDELTWTDWVILYDTSYDFLNGYPLANMFLQFKVAMSADEYAKRPFFQSLEIGMTPFLVINLVSDLSIKPKIWITKRNGAGTITLENTTTKEKLELKDLNNGETVYVDCENEEIVSSNQTLGVYRFDSHNDVFLSLARGENYLTSTGDFDLDIRYKGILLQEGEL